MRRLTFWVVLVAFVFSCGAQWPVLQAVAWANMVREYSQEVSLGQAVEMTLSGKYPCSLCKAIADKKNSEQAKLVTLHKQEKQICPRSFVAPFRGSTGSRESYLVRDTFLVTRADSPPTPPPRWA